MCISDSLEAFGTPWEALLTQERHYGSFWGALWNRCGCLETIWEPFGTPWGAFGAPLDAK